jgi:HSP20 family protein
MNETTLKKNETAPFRPVNPSDVTFTPRVDIMETADQMQLVLDLPGVKQEDLDIHFEKGELTVHGKCAPKSFSGRNLVTEYEVGDFYRAFLVGQEVAADRISADLKHGVLTVHLPKAEAAKARKISVKGN